MGLPRASCLLATTIAIVAGLVHGPPASAESGDLLCDPTLSTAASCIVTGTQTLVDPALLEFSAPDVQIVGTITVTPSGRCAAAVDTACTTDTDCASADSCLRPATLALVAPGALSIGRRGALLATSTALVGDRTGPPGGTITLTAGSILVQGSVRVAATRVAGTPPPGVPPAPAAGAGGSIRIRAAQSFALDDAGTLDATSSGGCGGTIDIGPVETDTILLAGSVLSGAASRGGNVTIAATGPVTVAGAIDTTNTSASANRASCPTDLDAGAGDVDISGGRIEIIQKGQIRASGKEGGGGSVTLDAHGDVLIDSVRPTAVDLFGGNSSSISTGGELDLSTTGGDVTISHGEIDVSGSGHSDAGTFVITAHGENRCGATGIPCERASDCGADDQCVAVGGNVRVDPPISGRGGTGVGFGCFLCEISGTGAVRVAGPIDVGGGNSGGQGGSLEVRGGGDVTIGPGAFTSSGADGDELEFHAGAASGSVGVTGGTLHVLDGTQLQADGAASDGISGLVQLTGCDIEVGANVRMTSVGGVNGDGIGVTIEAHESLRIDDGVSLVSNPFGSVTLHYRTTLDLAATSVREADTVDVSLHPELAPCARCGNGRVEQLETCDGPGSCPRPGDVCVPAGAVDACTCQDTCGTVPGVQAGEHCDGQDLDGATCTSQGFAGGTLACTADCNFDTSGCIVSLCGDGVVSGGEVCDPGGIGGALPDLGDHSCVEQGFAGGALVCGPDCQLLLEPHCSFTLVRACSTGADCPAGEACVGGCYDCGNGFVDPGEECDDGDENSDTAPGACRLDCRLPHCGDGVIDDGEACDDGASNGDDRPCTSACRIAVCGDGLLCSSAACHTGPGGGAEQCDDGNTVPDDACGTATEPCARAECGNGTRDPGEECDDGNTVNGDGCDANCTLPRCGNGIVDAGETCDEPSACCVGCHTVVCDDHNPCTTDTCDPVAGCVPTPVPGRVCDDHDACTTEDRCDQSGGCAGTALPCTSTDPCLVASCSAANGCTTQRLGGFEGLACLPTGLLRDGVRGLKGAVGRSRLQHLLATTRTVTRHLERAQRLGPGRAGRRHLTAAATATSRLRARLALLRASGVDGARVDAAAIPAADIAGALDLLLTPS